jgi:hypothetical protein
MTDQALIEKANEIIERVFALDDAVANARAFRAQLEDLHGRDLSVVTGPHVHAIAAVRAAILRAAIMGTMACLDPPGGDRASVGQILVMCKNAAVVAVMREAGTREETQTAALEQARAEYQALVDGEAYARGKRLRDDAIAHVLIRDDPTPTVEYETIYQLHDAAERLVTALYQVCDRGRPNFIEHQTTLVEGAKVFWDTHFRGMQAPSARDAGETAGTRCSLWSLFGSR